MTILASAICSNVLAAGSFSSRFGSPKGTSYPSNSSSLVSSPQAPPALQEDMFTRAIHPTKDKRDPVEAEGVELGTINSSGSIGLGDEGLGQALQSLSQEPQAGTEGVTSSSGRAGPAQTQPQTQSQPVSFQSLSALASQASKRWNKATTDVPAGDNAAAGASSSQHTPSVIENAPPTPYAAGADQPSSSHPVAAMPGSNAADTWKGGTQVQPGGNMPASTQTADAPRGDPQLQAASHHPPTSSADVDANDAARVSFIGNAVVDADASVSASYGDGKSQQPAAVGLGKTASMEKKWGYPVPTGSSMFERVRSRHYSQDEEAAAAPAGSSFAHDAVQPAPAFGQKPTGDAGPEEADAGQQGVLDRYGPPLL